MENSLERWRFQKTISLPLTLCLKPTVTRFLQKTEHPRLSSLQRLRLTGGCTALRPKLSDLLHHSGFIRSTERSVTAHTVKTLISDVTGERNPKGLQEARASPLTGNSGPVLLHTRTCVKRTSFHFSPLPLPRCHQACGSQKRPAIPFGLDSHDNLRLFSPWVRAQPLW